MTINQWIVAIMILLSFVHGTAVSFTKLSGQIGASLVAFVFIIGWYGALVMLLHDGGFW
jgi:hypothetical protein